MVMPRRWLVVAQVRAAWWLATGDAAGRASTPDRSGGN